MARGRPAGSRVLVLEDDALIAMELEATLRGAGWEVVGPARGIADALRLADEPRLDVALLDVNLRGSKSFLIAEALLERGVAVVFATAYDPSVIPPRLLVRPVLRKPIPKRALLAALAAASGGAPGRRPRAP